MFKRLGFSLMGLFIVGFIAAYFSAMYWPGGEPSRQTGSTKNTEATRVTLIRSYALSGEKSEESWNGPTDIQHLKNQFPEGEGWKYAWQPDGSLVLEHVDPGLAPADKEKRHLGIYDNQVAVLMGPPGTQGGLDRILSVPLEKLPPPIQEKIKQGTMEYMTEEELLMLCENYDEE